jgi:GTP cyclohydrolase II
MTAPAGNTREDHPRQLRLYSSCELPTEFGLFRIAVYHAEEEREHLLVHKGELTQDEPLFVRIHSECYTGEVLGSLKCDCRSQLHSAMKEIDVRGRGAIVYLRQEGRGIGLGNKIRAYAEQEKGANTIEANERIGFPADMRDYSLAAMMLELNSIRRVIINTNNPEKVAALQRAGIQVTEVIPSTSQPNPHNVDYLRTKYEGLGHSGLKSVVHDDDCNSRSG